MSANETDFTEKLRGLSFSFRIARRYLFSKKSHNAINIISGISATGVAIGTMALVVVLSVFNGFESLIAGMYSAFDPDLKITLVQGKSFDMVTPEFKKIRNLPGVSVFSEVIEENALLKFKEKQMPATVKGVTDDFSKITKIKSILYDGNFDLNNEIFEHAVPGTGVAAVLGLGVHFIDPLQIYAPKRVGKVNLLRPENSFNEQLATVCGVFSVKQPQYDDHLVLVSIKLARTLFEYDSSTVTAIELKVTDPSQVEVVKSDIKKILGDRFSVKNKYEQQESFFRIMTIEKWITYLILCFILLIASFNIIGSLSMLIIDKREDIATLRNLGADTHLIRRIFLYEGWLISIVGALSGIVLGALMCYLQQHFGFIRLGEGYIIDAYPVKVRVADFLLVFITVAVMGFLSSWYPVRYINKKSEI